MNKGNPKIYARVPVELLELLDSEVERVNLRRRGQPFDRSAWIRQAIVDKLRHSARSRGEKIEQLEGFDVFPDNGV